MALIKTDNLSKIALANLDKIISIGYPSICMHVDDLEDYIYNGKYIFTYDSNDIGNKGIVGFFDETKTTCYIDWGVKAGYIMLSLDKEIFSFSWSPEFSFVNEKDDDNIIKMMKLKYFW